MLVIMDIEEIKQELLFICDFPHEEDLGRIAEYINKNFTRKEY